MKIWKSEIFKTKEKKKKEREEEPIVVFKFNGFAAHFLGKSFWIEETTVCFWFTASPRSRFISYHCFFFTLLEQGTFPRFWLCNLIWTTCCFLWERISETTCSYLLNKWLQLLIYMSCLFEYKIGFRYCHNIWDPSRKLVWANNAMKLVVVCSLVCLKIFFKVNCKSVFNFFFGLFKYSVCTDFSLG